MSGISIKQASLQYHQAPQACYQNLQLEVAKGQWCCLLGASGCGKSSLLRQMAGLIAPEDHSELVLGDGTLSHFRQGIAYMAQSDMLLPWLNVIDNVCIETRLQGRRIDAPTLQRAQQLLASLGLGANAEQAPQTLSGGMRQRVALARTLMLDKPVVLMDEPFSALDVVNRHRLQALAAERLDGKTVMLVTHDPQEALRLGDQILLMQAGRLEPFETPDSACPRPIDQCLGEYQQRLLSQMGATL